MNHPSARSLARLFCLTTLLGCGGSSGPTTPVSGVASVDVAPNATTISLGGTVQLAATPKDANGAALAGQAVTWTSTVPAVATVTSDGLVHGVAAGAASITATADGRIGVATILVRVGAASVTLTPASRSLLAGETLQLAADVRDANGSAIAGFPVVWSSASDQIATVSSTGVVTAIAAGAVTITGSADGHAGTAAITVTPSADALASTISEGELGTCAVDGAGAARCWGLNINGSLGNGTAIPKSTVPVSVAGGLTFRGVVAGLGPVCGITTGGKTYCWGDNATGDLGNGTIANANAPVAVVNGDGFVAVSAGVAHTCGVTRAGQAYCWGENHMGQLGDGTLTSRTVPTAVGGGLTFANVSAGGATCGVTFDHTGYCWGPSSAGQVGNGSTALSVSSPALVSGSIAFRVIRAGPTTTCGLSTAGAAYCWGDGQHGELGNGTTTASSVPLAVSGGHVFASIDVGFSHVCARTAAGDVFCWGENSLGALGDGTTTRRLTPAQTSGGVAFASVTAGVGTTCGRSTSGAVYCWGSNIGGQLGNGTTTESHVPVPVSGAAMQARR